MIETILTSAWSGALRLSLRCRSLRRGLFGDGRLLRFLAHRDPFSRGGSPNPILP
jgi:hypothetical protein